MLGQEVGFPVPEDGAGQIRAALLRRLSTRDARVDCGRPVSSLVVGNGEVLGVWDAEGQVVRARRGVLADVPAPVLYRDLVGESHLPARLVDDLDSCHWDDATIKVDWALSGPVPWSAPGVRGAGTVHMGADLDGLAGVA